MKNTFLLVLLMMLIASFVSAEQFTGKCVGVSDGDTIKVMRDGRSVKIRLEGIDCPENSQGFGARAKRFTSSKVYNKQVTVYYKNKDRYGRIVGRIFVGGEDICLSIVRNGLAWHYKAYSRDKRLAAAEISARNDRLYIWSVSNPIAPWKYRKLKKKRKKVSPANQCTATTLKGTRCKRRGNPYCWQHAKKKTVIKKKSTRKAYSSVPGRCQATTKKGTQCKRKGKYNGYCWQHK